MIAEYSGFYARLRAHCRTLGLFSKQNPLLVAVSGGLDSMFLLDFMAWLAARDSLRLAVWHFEHGLRAGEDEAETALVQKRAEALGLSCFCDRADCRLLAAERGQGLEEACRYARYRAFQAAAAEAFPAEAVGLVLAHHQDDQAETLLLNLGRGCGLDGLCGMRAFDPPYIRPLLGLSRREIETFARQRGLDWLEDSSNLSCDFLRNRLRHVLLPQWRELLGYDPTPQLAHTASLLQEEREWRELETQKLWERSYETETDSLNLKDLLGAAPALQAAVFKKYCALRAASIQQEQIRQFVRVLRQLPCEQQICLSGGTVLQLRRYRLSPIR